jgi:hypothetical protein
VKYHGLAEGNVHITLPMAKYHGLAESNVHITAVCFLPQVGNGTQYKCVL